MFNFEIKEMEKNLCPLTKKNCTTDCAAIATIGVVVKQFCPCDWEGERISVLDNTPIDICPLCQKPLQNAELNQMYVCNLSASLIHLELPNLQAHIDYFKKFNLSCY